MTKYNTCENDDYLLQNNKLKIKEILSNFSHVPL